jgi:hypothetical protein
MVLAAKPEDLIRKRTIELLRTLIRENPTAGKDQLSRLASKQDIGRDVAIATLEQGEGKHWFSRKGPHNKSCYTAIG